MVFYLDGFFYFLPPRFLFRLWFFKSGDVFIRKISHLLPLWFFGYHSTTSNPCGFYSACSFSKVTGELFIRGEVFRFPSLWLLIKLGFFRKFPSMFLFRVCAQTSSMSKMATEPSQELVTTKLALCICNIM